MNQDSSVVEHQARDLEVRVRVPVQIKIFLLKFEKILSSRSASFAVFTYITSLVIEKDLCES